MLEQPESLPPLTTEQCGGLANQQVTETDHAYFAGLIDGEGCITICRTNRKDLGANYFTYSPRVLLGNTNENIILGYINYLKAMEITYWVNTDCKRKPNRRYAWNILVGGMPGQKKLLTSLLPYLKGKKALAELLLEYIDRRIMRNEQHKRIYDSKGHVVNGGRAKHDERDVADYEKIRSMIDSRNLRDHTTPINPELRNMKIESAPA